MCFFNVHKKWLKFLILKKEWFEFAIQKDECKLWNQFHVHDWRHERDDEDEDDDGTQLSNLEIDRTP